VRFNRSRRPDLFPANRTSQLDCDFRDDYQNKKRTICSLVETSIRHSNSKGRDQTREIQCRAFKSHGSAANHDPEHQDPITSRNQPGQITSLFSQIMISPRRRSRPHLPQISTKISPSKFHGFPVGKATVDYPLASTHHILHSRVIRMSPSDGFNSLKTSPAHPNRLSK